MRRLSLALSLALTLAALLAAAPAGAACRLALSLGLDVSASVDAAEYRLQLDGLAAALLRPEVQEAMLAFPGAAVRLHVYEWAGQGSLRVLLDWTEIAGPQDLLAAATALRGSGRVQMDPSTAMGEAMLAGGAALAAQRDCARHTLDLSGDGRSNAGPRPRDVGAAPQLAGVTVNGLVVGADPRSAADPRDAATGELLFYYRAEVIRGPGAFTELARGFAGFEEAMARKLLRELEAPAVAALPRPATPARRGERR